MRSDIATRQASSWTRAHGKIAATGEGKAQEMGFGIALLGVAIVVVGMLSFALTSRTTRRGRVQVHVDDLVTGRLPPICAITGVPTSQLVPVESSRGGFQPWWLLLLFLGPVGIAAIAVLHVVGGRTDRVSGVLPITTEAVEHYLDALAVARRATGALVVCFVVGFSALLVIEPTTGLPVALLAVLIGACVFVIIVANTMAPTRWIDLQLDGSGRWVTIERAHPAFSAAVQDRYRHQDSHYR